MNVLCALISALVGAAQISGTGFLMTRFLHAERKIGQILAVAAAKIAVYAVVIAFVILFAERRLLACGIGFGAGMFLAALLIALLSERK